MNFLKRCWAEIDLDALDFNFEAIKAQCPDKEIIAVMKANAYGHSDVICAREYYRLGVRCFAVSNFHEAERIREIIGDNGCFLLVFGYIGEEYFDDILRLNLTVTAGSVEYAVRLNSLAAGKNVKIPVHIAVDTGMTRVGVRTADEAGEIAMLKNLEITGMYSHFAVSDMTEGENVEFTRRQYEKISQLAKNMNIPFHIHNRGGIAFHDNMQADWARPGIILYGLSPNTAAENPLKLRQVMTLKSVIDQLKVVPKGVDIGYGRTYTTDSEQVIALVPTGYADGYSRALSGRGFAAVNGVLCPIRGRVCMDQMMIDVTKANAVLGDEVKLYSGEFEETGIDHIADILGTIGYEVVCSVSARVPRAAVRKGEIVEVVNER